jgi:hypothetical protein
VTSRTVLSIIIVSWNVRELLRRALTSAYASWGDAPGLEIVVVDNASEDGTVAMLRESFPQVRLIPNPDNRGFPAANNQGLEVARGEFILLLNPDTEVVDDALPRLVAYGRDHPEVGMIGPRLLYPDGSVQSSRRRFPTLLTLFLESTWLQRWAPRKALRRYYFEDVSADAQHPVDWITGAAMFTRRAVVDAVGGMDENFFMYSEELDWCRRVKEAGWKALYTPGVTIVHHEGKSSEQVVPARHVYFQSSKVYYARKYHGPLVAEALRLWLLGQYLWQMGVEGAKWLLDNRRPLRASRLSAYRRVLKSGLRAHRSHPRAKEIS